MSAATPVWGHASQTTMYELGAYVMPPSTAAVLLARNARRNSAVPTPANKSLASIDRLRPIAGGNGKASHVNGDRAADWSLARSGAPVCVVGFQSGRWPFLKSWTTISFHGSICRIGSLTMKLIGGCAPGSDCQG